MTSAATGTTDTPRYEIVAGGTPSPEELAALTIALTPVVVQRSDGGAAEGAPAWLKAALHEGVTGLRVTSAVQAADLR